MVLAALPLAPHRRYALANRVISLAHDLQRGGFAVVIVGPDGVSWDAARLLSQTETARDRKVLFNDLERRIASTPLTISFRVFLKALALSRKSASEGPTFVVASGTWLPAFARVLVEAAAGHAAAVKINVAFFEVFGSAGIAALERVRAAIPSDLPLIADAKRADISNTSARQAVALFDSLGADAVTANPYLGRDALAPFLEYRDRFVYVLCRTSNPGGAELQNQPLADGAPKARVILCA